VTAGNWHQGDDGRCIGCGQRLHGSGSCIDCAAAAMADRPIAGLDANPRLRRLSGADAKSTT